jgi:L-aspartate oxidase
VDSSVWIDYFNDRKESRGLHYTTDYPDPDDTHWLTPTIIDR